MKDLIKSYAFLEWRKTHHVELVPDVFFLSLRNGDGSESHAVSAEKFTAEAIDLTPIDHGVYVFRQEGLFSDGEEPSKLDISPEAHQQLAAVAEQLGAASLSVILIDGPIV